jgi:hypothetical protein
MTASETPEVKPALPGVGSLIASSYTFLSTPPHASVLYGFAGWLLIPVLLRLGGTFLDPSFADAIDLISGILLFGLSLWATAAMTIVITGIARPDLAPKDAVTSVSQLAWRRAGTLIWVGLLVTILQMFGFLLLIIPGIIFTVWFAFADTEVILTGAGTFSALEQSRERVRGYFFPVLWRMLAFSLILAGIISLILWPVIILSGITDPMMVLTDPPAWLDTFVSVLEILLMPLILSYELHLYFSLRKP